MKRLFVFGIGGTGCRVLRSLNFLLAAGIDGLGYDTQVFPIIIDYDAENGDKKRTLKCINNYANIHKIAYANHPDQQNQYFVTRVREMRDALADEGMRGNNSSYELVFTPKQGEKKYKHSIGYGDLVGENLINTQFLLESLYDASPEEGRAELEIDMTVGFKGNPNIGSVVFHELQATPEYKDFVQLFNPATDRIMIVGSLFGGTGSSGIPELIMSIRNHNEIGIQQARLGVIMVLPYFSLPPKSGSPIHSTLFNSKTKAALSYYQDSGINKLINSIYYIGDKNETILDHQIGGENQLNRANIVEFISALSIIHFINSDPDNSRGGNSATEYYKYAIEGTLYGNNGKQAVNLLDLVKDTENSYVFTALNSLTMALKYFHECVEEDKRSMGSVQWYRELGIDTLNWEKKTSATENNPLKDLCYYLHEFYDMYKEWLDELADEKNGHSLSLYNLTTPDDRGNYGFHTLFSHKEQVKGDKKTTPTISKKDFDAEINGAFSDKGHFRNGQLTTQKEFIFMDIFRTGCDALLKDGNIITM